ncbi:hypothetical protein FSP39_023637 [Pinctada imbricata]|uniref:Uncharacterized protein n=1 Tax=Pinctada imbricata TaxID=66713 RepID=A0AA88YBK4_PINIB|nr:hypothetical protein FSP39_023637 [Pinctada imbricata]
MGNLASSIWGGCGETIESGEEAVEIKNTEVQETITIVSQPSNLESTPLTAPSSEQIEEDNFRDQKQEETTHLLSEERDQQIEEDHFQDQKQEKALSEESNNNTPVTSGEPSQHHADVECLTNSYATAEDLVCEVSSPTECLAPTCESVSRPQSIHIEEDSSFLAPAEEKVHLLKGLNLKLVQMMETVDSLVTEQPSTGAVLEEGSTQDATEVLSSLVNQSEVLIFISSGSASMHTSTGSEGLEDEDKEPFINGDKQAEEVEPITEKTEQKSNKEIQKEEKSSKSKKKEDKTIDHILRALSSLHTTEEKLAALCKKYADLHEEHRVVQGTLKQTQRKLTVVTREKDQLQTEHTKAVMAKSKLEGLCRELQKHNQVIRQESLQRAREEDEKRKEISSKFQTTISDIQQQMTEHHERNIKLREENQELASKLKKFIEQYEVREKQVEKIMQHRELEQKLADAKLQQASSILTEEQERNKKEKELLLLQATEGQKKATLLEAQLGMYKERYEEFQSTISKSNDMFQKFKTEMDKMTKRIKKLERDGAAWKNKWENANKALLEMAEEKTLYDKEKPVLMNKIQKLESLCRAMQAERLGRKAMEASNIEVPKVGCETTESDSNQSTSIKTDDQSQKTEGATNVQIPNENPPSLQTPGSKSLADSTSNSKTESANQEKGGINQSQPRNPDDIDDDDGYDQDDDDDDEDDDDASPEENESENVQT